MKNTLIIGILIGFFIAFLFICEGVGNSIYGQTVWSWQPDSTLVDDSMVYQGGATNYGYQTTIHIGRDGGDNQFFSFVMFTGYIDSLNARDINLATEIDSVHLILEAKILSGTVDLYGAQVDANWGEGSINGQNEPSASTPYSDTITAALGTDSLNITDIVKDWLSPNNTSYYGIRLLESANPGVGNIIYYSSSDSTGSEPTITTYYTVVSEELTGILPKVYKSKIQPKVKNAVIIPKVRN